MAAHQVNITDRAHRYRAQKLAPVAGKKCLLCGSTRNLVPDHWDGHPDHTNPANLETLCKSCNTAKGAAFAKAGRGRLTKQYNPTKGGGAATVGEWMQAVGAITPHQDRGDRGLSTTMSTRDAVDMIRATPQSKRREFAAKLGRHNPANPWPFSRPDARRTTPAHGGIAYHQGKRKARKSPDDLNAEYLKSLAPAAQKHAKATTFKGRSIKPTEGGSWVVPSIDKESEFDSLQDAKAFITSWKRNPSDWEAGNSVAGRSKTEQAGALKRHIEYVEREERHGRKLSKSELSILKQRFRKAAKRKNPAAASAEVFEDFHGYEPTEVVTVSKQVHHHAHLACLGTLVQLDVWGVDGKGHKVTGFKKALLACNEGRDQLFIEGGDQSVNLADFGIRKPHETETLGRVTNIGYQTNKTHLGDEGGEAVYVHRFRATNQNGKHVVVKMTREPDLIYDVRNEQLLFSGGSYEILREGINK